MSTPRRRAAALLAGVALSVSAAAAATPASADTIEATTSSAVAQVVTPPAAPAPVVTAAAASSTSSRGAKVLAFAKRQLGDRYRYGATGPNAWDCSGLTQGAYKAAGKKIPRTTYTQYRAGKKVAKSNLKKGDLVFFYSGPSHVGIYAGNGKVIHASRPGKPVAYIKMSYMPYKGARRF